MLELHDVPADQTADRLATVLDRVARIQASARFLDLAEARDKVSAMAEGLRDRSDLLDVVDEGRRVGHAWLAHAGGGELLVHDLELQDPGRVGELVPELVDRARAGGARLIGVGVHPGDTGRIALGDQPGFELRATNMALLLDGEIADPGDLELRRMTPSEFDEFMAGNVEEYAGELHAAGMTEEAAAQQSREQMAALLPEGAASPGMHFFTAWVSGTPVGSLWLAAQDPMAFVYDIVVREEQRRKGYGAAIMNAAAVWCRAEGHPVLGLNVFAHNPGARALYDGLGYRVTQDYRALDVPDAG